MIVYMLLTLMPRNIIHQDLPKYRTRPIVVHAFNLSDSMARVIKRHAISNDNLDSRHATHGGNHSKCAFQTHDRMQPMRFMPLLIEPFLAE